MDTGLITDSGMVRGSKTALASKGRALKPQGVKAPQVSHFHKMYKMFDICWRDA